MFFFCKLKQLVMMTFVQIC